MSYNDETRARTHAELDVLLGERVLVAERAAEYRQQDHAYRNARQPRRDA